MNPDIKALLEAISARPVTYVTHTSDGRIYKVLGQTGGSVIQIETGTWPIDQFRLMPPHPIYEQGLLVGFYIAREGDPPPTFTMDPSQATHLEFLTHFTKPGVWLLAIWEDKTTYLAYWSDKPSAVAHLARAGVTAQELGRQWSASLQAQILADARRRPAYRQLT